MVVDQGMNEGEYVGGGLWRAVLHSLAKKGRRERGREGYSLRG